MTTPFPGDEQALQHDPLAELPLDFSAFYVEEQDRWLRYACSRLGNRQDAEDAVQNAGIRLYEKWERALASPDPQAVRAFAWKLVRDAVTDLLRHHGRQKAKALKLARQPGPADTGHEPVDQLLDRAALRWAMAKLTDVSPVQAEVVRLRQLGVDYPTIAAVLEIATSTAKTYYSLGTRHLEFLLNPRRDHEDKGN